MEHIVNNTPWPLTVQGQLAYDVHQIIVSLDTDTGRLTITFEGASTVSPNLTATFDTTENQQP